MEESDLKDLEAIAFCALNFLSYGRPIRLSDFGENNLIYRSAAKSYLTFRTLMLSLVLAGFVEWVGEEENEKLYKITKKGLSWIKNKDGFELTRHLQNRFDKI